MITNDPAGRQTSATAEEKPAMTAGRAYKPLAVCDWCTTRPDGTAGTWSVVLFTDEPTFGIDGGPSQRQRRRLTCPRCLPLVQAAAWQTLADLAVANWTAEHGTPTAHTRSEIAALFLRLADHLEAFVWIDIDELLAEQDALSPE